MKNYININLSKEWLEVCDLCLLPLSAKKGRMVTHRYYHSNSLFSRKVVRLMKVSKAYHRKKKGI